VRGGDGTGGTGKGRSGLFERAKGQMARGTRGDGAGQRPGPRLGIELLWLAGYAAAVLLGRAARWDGLPFTLVWPAAGVGALAWAAVGRRGGSPIRFGAALVLVTVALNLLTGVPAAMALVFGAANLVQPVVFCRVLGDRAGRAPRAEDLLVTARASLAGALASASLIVPGAVLLQHGPAGLSLVHWVVRNGASMFVLASLVAAGTAGARPELRVPLRERVAVDVAVLVSCLPVALVAQPAAWLPGPLLVWSALRRPTRVVAGQVALVGASFVVLTWLGIGPFGALAPLAKMLFAQAYVVVVVFVALALALVRDARALLLEEVAEREQHFRLLAEHSGDAIGRVARDGTVLWTSPQTEAVFGWSAAQLAERDRQDVIDPRDLPAVVAATDRVFSGTVDVETIRFRVRRPEGTSVRWVESRLRPVHRGGAVVEMVTSARDVTSGVRREELLAAAYEDVDRARELLHGSVDAMREVFLVLAVAPAGPSTAPGTRVLLANAAAVERFAVDDPVGHDLADLLPTAREEVADRVRRAAAGAGPQALRLDHERPDGTWAGTEELMVTSVGQDRLIAVLRDVTGDEARLRQVSEDHELAVHAATHDALTGLPNRAALRQRLSAALAACPAEEQVGVVFIDLDGFKEVNDRWGHAAGDVVLRAVGNRLSALVRPADTASRLAGDEFVLVLRHLPAQWDADQLLASVQSRLGQPVEVTWADERTEQTRRVLVRPAASMGVVTAGAGADLDVEALLAAADSRMYEDKRRRAGAGGVHVSDELSESLVMLSGLSDGASEPAPGGPTAVVPAPRGTLGVEGDRLTGLPDRAAVVAAARAALARGEAAVALLLCDVDAFHQVNATYGGDVGDRVLARIAERMVRTASAVVAGSQEAASAVVGRVGPDEFCVLLELRLPAARLVDEIVSDVASEVLAAFVQPLEVDGLEVRVALTVGSSVLADHGAPVRAEELFDQAHVAMRSAVRDGSRSARFDVAMHERARRRLTDEHLLRLAVEGDSRGGQLVNHYQPLVQPRTGAVVGVEALVRWQHPERGLVWPGEFVPLAEETGLVVGLTWQVLEGAAAQAARWRDTLGTAAPAVGLNVSGRCLVGGELVLRLEETMARHRLDPTALVVEVTETVATRPAALDTLAQVADLGLQIAVDDFGTGHSSLARLARFPVHFLKIDRQFVVNADRDPRDRVVLRAVAELAHALGLLTVAEGIETAAQLAVVQDAGCDLLQGFLLGRPAPAEAVTPLLGADVGTITVP
jgi:diguanylate cyclase (GGDEF)-like protein/PAS domain S-box-containing protein